MYQTKEQYQKYIDTAPWLPFEEIFNSSSYVPSKIASVDIDPQKWLGFSVENFDSCNQNWEQQHDHYNKDVAKLVDANLRLGRNKHNTFELNYGTKCNKLMLDLFGQDNHKKLNLVEGYTLIRLIVKSPGHGLAWHFDNAGRYKSEFATDLEFDSDMMCKHGKLVRYWFPVSHWSDGHVMQIAKTVISQWAPGDVYEIPWGEGHGSMNFGYRLQLTVSLTGIRQQTL